MSYAGLRSFRPLWVALLAVATFAVGCGTNNVRREEVLRFRLGSTSLSQVRSAFGEPSRSASQSVGTQSYTIQYFTDHTTRLWEYDWTGLAVEFKDGKLNGYDYVSSVKEDKTLARVEAMDSIVIGKSTKDDVIDILGEPAGRMRIPSMFPSLKEFEKDPNVAEVWTWNEYSGQKDYGGYYRPQPRFRFAYVVLDHAGKVIKKGSADRPYLYYYVTQYQVYP